MPSLLNRYATPLITGLFLVSLVSGIALFFHIGPSAFHGMHEWLSMVLIVPFVLHIWKNWKPMLCYLRRAPMAISLALSAVAAAVFFLPAGGAGEQRDGPVQFRIASQVLHATPEVAAPLFGLTEDRLLARLQAAGMNTAASGLPMDEIAAAAGKSNAELATALLSTGG
ncbi:MAG: DUF4405 domain-containing protein [Rhodobacteraceae bacterium]|nr:DUF4405 domain-containing protein [Paracoccaceae bacterium]